MIRFRGLVIGLFLCSLVALTPAAQAATASFRVLMDTDNSTATGCTVSGMDGVDQILVTTVEIGATTAAVTATSLGHCGTPTLTPITTSGWPAAYHAPSGRLMVETRIPLSMFQMASNSDLPRNMRIGIEATKGSLTHTALTDSDGSIVFLPAPPHGRRRAVGPPGTPRSFTLDGVDTEWLPLDEKFDGIGAGGSFGLRILRAYAFVNTTDDFIYFLYDANVSADAPFADDDRHKRVPGHETLEIPAPGVLGNDEDNNTPPEPLTARPVSSPLHGTVIVNSDGSFTYTPENPSSRAADVFEYRANNGTKDSNTAKVKIKVGIGADDAFHGPQGLAIHIDAPGVLENDDAGNIAGLTATLLSAPSHGTVILNPNGGFTYTPDATFVGDDTFTYTVSGHGPSDTATVVITLDPKEQGQDNLPPHVLKDKFKVDENSPAGTLVGKVKVTDPNSGDTHTFTILSGNIGNAFAINPSTGQITVAAPPSINFETRAHYDLVVRAADNGTPSLSDAETIEIDVQNKNDAPVGVTQTVSTAEEVPLAITLSATDEDGNSLTYSIGVNPAHGVLTGSAPNVTYTPNQNYVGADSFTFTASDGTATSAPVTIHINVTAINDEPLFTAGPDVTVNEDSGAYAASWATGVAPGPANATDEAGQTVSFNVSNNNNGLFLVQPAIDGSGNLTFTPALNATGFATVTATIVDNGSNTPPNDNTGATAIFTITLTPVNDPPSFVKGPDQSANEDGGPQTALGWATLISPGPADESGQAVAFNIVTNTNPGLFASGPSITPAGDLTYTPAPNASGVATITITLSDNGGGTNTSAPQSFMITINGVNDAPVNTVPAAVQVTAEETPLVFNAANGNAIQTSDIDVAAGTMQFQLSVTSGTLTLATTAGLTITTGTDGIDEASIIGTGTLTSINAALNGLSYTPNANYFGSDTLTLVINDNGNTGSGGAQSDTDTVTISITAVDDSPTLTAGGGSPAFVEDAGPVAVDPAITPADVDNANLVSATVTITNLLDAGLETLAASTGGTSITAVYAAPTLTLTGSDTLANYQTVLRSITYENTSGAPTTTARSITFVVNDGNSNSNTVTKTLSVTPANDAPVLTAGGGSPTFTEDGAAAVVDNGLAISDVDNATLASATVTITNLLNAGAETLAVNVGATGLIASYSAPTLTLTGTATLAQYETVLRTVTYSNSSNTPNTTARVISFQVNDGAANSNTVTTSVSVVANDDAPVLTAGGGSPAFTEDGAAVAVDPAITPSDVDSANLASATVTITNLLDAGLETLAASTGGTSITAVYAAPTLTLTGSDTLANYQTVLRSITYNNASQNPNTTARSISFVVNDGTSNSNTVSKSVTVTPVNDAPVLVAGGGSPTFTEDGAPAVVDNGLTISDVDNTTLASATVTITNLLNAGAETLAVNVGATGIIASYSAPTLTLTGVATLAQYETVLRTVTYSNSSNTPNTTARVISFQVNDGAANSNTVTKSVSVVATDDAPTLTAGGASPTFVEDGAAVAVDPAITPSDVDSANLSSATVTITNLLNAGSETLAASTGGTSITAVYAAPTLTLTGSDTLANYQAVLRSITYNNTSQNPNTTARSISFVVNDGTSNSNTVTKTLSITPTNDAPVLTSGAGAPVFTEDGAPAVVDGGLTISDVDSANLATATVTITNLLNAGAETLAVNVGATGLIASYVAPTLTLTGSATLAQYETVLRTVTYSNSSNTPNTTARVISFVVNDGAANSNTASKSVAVVATNDAPVLTAGGGSPAFTEGAGPVAVDPAITPSDVDSASLSSATVTITNLLDAGLETLAASTGGTSITAVYAAPTLTLTGVDTLANYQTVLRSVTYNNSSNAPNTTGRSISFVVNDGAANSNTVTKTVSITTVNSAPTLVAGGGAPTFVEDAGPVVVDNGITPADVDSATLASATITITNPIDGAAELLAATTGATSIVASYVAPTLTLTGVDTIANYQTVLRTVTYENTSNTPNTTARVISFKVNDGSLDSNVTTKNVAVVPANDAPVVTTTAGTTSFTEAAGAVIVDSGVTPTDVDSATLASATVTITNLLDAGLETLAASTGGTSITAVYAAPVLTLTGVDTKANYQTVLRSVTYNNGSNAPNTTGRSISFVVNDGSANSNTASKTVSITTVNSAPTLVAGGGAPTFVEDAGPVVVDNGITPADVDSATLASATITITNPIDGAAELLAATTGATSIVASYVAPTLTLTGVDTIANYQTVLRTVTYENTSNTPNTTARVISFKVNDGSLDSNVTTKNVTIISANDAPVVTTTAGNTSFTEAAGAVIVDSGVTPTDVDSASLASATVTITNLLDAGLETLAASTGGTSITAVYAAPVLTLTGVDTKANYQTVLRSVTYNNGSNAPNPANRVIAFQVNDGTLNSNVANKTVTVTSVNSAPTLTTSGGTTAFVEDAGSVIVDALVTPADVDSTTLASAQVTITNLLDAGLETLSATTGATAIVASYSAPTLTLTGVDSIANYQTVLRTVRYNNTSNTPNTTVRSISFKVNDGTIDSNIPTKNVSVTPANDAPSLATSGGSTPFTEDGGTPFIDTGVTITDPDSPTMASATVTISNLLDAGAEILSADTTGTSITASYVAPVLTLTGVDTIANYHLVLRKVLYNNTSQNPNTTNRTISFQVNDGAAVSNVPTRTVTITAVNDAPTVATSVGTSAFVEDAGPIVVDNAVTPADIDNTTLASATVTITNLVDVGFETLAATTGGTLITANYAAPTLTLTGVDTIANYQTVLRSITYNNSSNAPTTTTRTISFKVNDGALDSNIPTKSVSVTATNDAPVLTASGTLAYTENQAATALGVTIGITDPDSANMSSATVTITGNPQVAADVLAMATQNGISATYVAPTLTLTGSSSIANYITALQSVTYQNTSDDPSTLARTITYQVNDGTANSNTATSTVNVTATNDAPTNNPPTNPQSVNEDTPLNFTGAGNTVSVTDPDAQSGSNFSVQVVTTNGTTTIVTPVGVTFTPVAGNGTASYTITGTLANINTSLTSLRFNPTLNFPNALASGTASVQLITNDGGNTPAPAQGDNDTFNITVNQVNDAPTAGNDAWDTIGNTELRVDLAAGVTPNVPDTTTNSNGVASNDSDLAVENNPFTVTSIVGCADLVTPYDCTLASGSIVSMNAAGTFTFKPSPTIATGTPTDDTFQYVITDQPVAGTPQTATGTVTIHVFDKVWYVKQGGTGNGRSDSPLGSFTGINNAGGAGDSDSPTDYIFVHAGTSITTSIELEANQHLLGEGVGISINRNLNGNGAPTNLVAAGVKPIITSAANTVAITAAMAAEVRGLNLSSSAGNPIDVTAAGAYTGSPSLTISDNLFTTASAEDIDVNAGATGTLALTIQNNDWVVVGPHSSQGIDVRTTAGTLNLNVNTNTNVNVAGTGILIDGSGGGTVNIVGFNDNFVHQNTVGSGITVTSATFDTTPGAPFQTVAGGITRVGTVGNGVGGAGMVLTNVAGDLSFTDLDITNDNGSGLAATGLATYTGSAGFQIAVPAGVATITSVNGPAVNLNTVTASLPLSTISSLNSATTGVNLASVIGTVTAPASSSITNAGTTDFNITGGTATVTYDGTITDDLGQLVNVSGSTGGTKQFLGAITDGNDGDGSGISLTTNTGATIRFAGGLLLSTGGNPAFTATGGGTVEVCDENPCNAAATGALVNTINTTTGIALNVANTTIGTNSLEFRTINAGTAASGPTNGIILNNTGTGGLKVKGTGAANSGGVIQQTTSYGIVLTNTGNVSLVRMSIHDTDDRGINGSGVAGFVFTDGTIFNFDNGAHAPGNTVDAMTFTNLTGTVTIARTTLGPDGTFVLTPNPPLPENKGIIVRNTNVANLNMTVTGTTFTQLSNDGIDAEVTGGTGTLNVDGSTGDGANVFSSINGRSVTFSAPTDNAAAQVLDLTIKNNTFTNVGIGGRWLASARTTINARYNANTMSGTSNDAIRSESDATNAALSPKATVNATINGNNMGGGGIFISNHRSAIANIALTNNPGIGFFGINVNSDRGSTIGIDVTNNTVSVNGASPFFRNAMYLQTSDNGGGASTICAKISGNTLTSTGATSASVVLDTVNGQGTIGLEGYVSGAEEAYLSSVNTIVGSPQVAIDNAAFVNPGGNCVTSTP
jgi:hypothetical protein